MAYLLGFIAADGTVSKDSNQVKISLSTIDLNFLEKIQKEMEIEKPIFTYETNNGFMVSELKFTSERIKKQLATYNIVPRKTYSFEFPQKLKKEYYIDFIRGYFDGDGSVSTAGAGIRFQICGYRLGVLKEIIKFFEECGIPTVKILERKNGENTLYYFQYSTVSTRNIFNVLYYDDCFCLPRKYKKYISLL